VKRVIRNMLRFNRGVFMIWICFGALANVQCGQDGSESETGSPTLTIHALGQDERVLCRGRPAWVGDQGGYVRQRP
jgi:hypothetical protein